MLSWTTAYLLSEWIIRLVMLVYVPRRRTAAAARAWLLLIFVFPWGGLVLYMLFGRAQVPRRRAEILARISQLIRTTGREFFEQYSTHPDLATAFEQAITLAQNLGDFPILSGNQFELLPDYEEAVDRLVADIAAAQDHVHLEYYIFANDSTGKRVAEAMIAAARRAVKCRVLMDSLGSRPALRTLAPRLRKAGIEVVEVLPVGFFRREHTRRDLRNHRKIAVIDGRIGYIGSQNLVNADFKRGLIYQELVTRVRGPVVLQLQAVLLTDYCLETAAQPGELGLFTPPETAGSSLAQVLPSGPGYLWENTHCLILALLHAAQRRVVFTTPYFVPDESLFQALQTAVLRGVEVHLVTPRKADQILVGLAQRSYYEQLLEAGVHIHLYKPSLLHAKHVTIDDSVALIGSSNLDIRSFALNAEITAIVYDAAVVGELRKVQQQNLADAELLTLDAWRSRSWLRKTLENTARLVDSVL
jgi:cardiolipin synthase A/B